MHTQERASSCHGISQSTVQLWNAEENRVGMILALLSLFATLSMDTAADLGYILPTPHSMIFGICIFACLRIYFITKTLNSNNIQLTLSALSRMLIYTGVFEFICSQSPHSIKRLIVGVFYAIGGLTLIATWLAWCGVD